MNILKEKILFIGMGKFGTSIAYRLSLTKNKKITFYTRSKETAEHFNKTGTNPRCFTDFKFKDTVAISELANIKKTNFHYIFLTIESESIIEIVSQIKDYISKKINIIICSKGMSRQSPFFYTQIVKNILGKNANIFVFSGPNFADEIIRGELSVTTLAGDSALKTYSVANLFKPTNINIEVTNDVNGVQLFGAMKNVMAITVGILEGLGYGKNRVIRTLMNFVSEMQRLSKAYGAKESTAYLSAGIGDIMLTCFDEKSRNKKFGIEIGKNNGIANINKEYLVEGYYAVGAIREMSMQFGKKRKSLDYINALYDILYHNADPLKTLNKTEKSMRDINIYSFQIVIYLKKMLQFCYSLIQKLKDFVRKNNTEL